MKLFTIFVGLFIFIGIAHAKVGTTIIEHKVYPVNVTINADRLDSPYRPFDGDVALSLGDDFREYHKFPIGGLYSNKLPLDNQLVAYFAPGNTVDVLLYEANENKGHLAGSLTVILAEEIKKLYVPLDPKTCFHCRKLVCAKGLVERIALEIPGPNSDVKTVIFTKPDRGFEGKYQEISMDQCAE